jgi:hypothetical protein
MDARGSVCLRKLALTRTSVAADGKADAPQHGSGTQPRRLKIVVAKSHNQELGLKAKGK